MWEAVTQPGHLARCHPFCAENEVIRWPGPDSIDRIRYYSGLELERRFQTWLEGRGYDLEIGRPGGATSFVSWRIDARSGDSCELSISIEHHIARGVPPGLRWAAHLLVVRPRLKAYLSSVLQGIDWWVTTGQPVTADQFGRHPWFSGRESPEIQEG